ncbi:MAG: hypothetical protein AAGI89_03845 [Pseudomonadota bacterium]
MRLTIVMAAIAALTTGCTTADKQAQSSAYEACKSRTDPASRDRCIEAEQDRLRAERAGRDDRCLAGIEEQRLRRAMIDGRAAPTNKTGPAEGC